MIDQTVALYFAFATLMVLIAIACLIWIPGELKAIGFVCFFFALLAIANGFMRANDVFQEAHPKPPPARAHTVTVYCPPEPTP